MSVPYPPDRSAVSEMVPPSVIGPEAVAVSVGVALVATTAATGEADGRSNVTIDSVPMMDIRCARWWCVSSRTLIEASPGAAVMRARFVPTGPRATQWWLVSRPATDDDGVPINAGRVYRPDRRKY